MSNDTRIGQALDTIRAWMEEHHVTPYRLAVLAGVSDKATRRIAQPGYTVRSDILEKLERAAQGEPPPVRIGRPRKAG